MNEIVFDWRDHIQNAIVCYIVSICDEDYTKENLIQCQIDLCGYIDDAINELMEEKEHEKQLN